MSNDSGSTHRLVPTARRALSILTLFAVVGGLWPVPSARAAMFTWDATTAGASWSTNSSWQGVNAPPNDGSAQIVFSNLGTTSSNIGNYSINSITFTSAANAYTFTGDNSPGEVGTMGLEIGAGGLTQDASTAQTFNLNVNLSASQTWTLNGTGALNFTYGVSTTFSTESGTTFSALTIDTESAGATINSVISGGGSLIKTGAGTLTLSGANTYSGGTTLAAGGIGVANNAALGQSTGTLKVTVSAPLFAAAANMTVGNPVSLATGTTLTLGMASAGANALTLSGTVSGAGALIVNNPDAVTSLTGANTYTGGTTLVAGSLAVGNDTGLGTGALTVTGNTTLYAAVGDRTLANAISLDAATTLTLGVSPGGAHNLTLNGVISGTGGIVKNGNATLTLANAANTFTGGLTLNDGTLAVAGDGSLGGATNIITLNASSLQFSASTTSARTFNLGGAGTLGTAAGTTLTLGSGANVNGGFLGAAGTVAFANGSALNATTTALNGTVTTAGAVSFANATLRGSVTVGAGGTLTASNTVVASAGTVTVNGTVNTSGLENDGVVNVPNGGTLANTGTTLVLGGGSRTYIGTGAAPGGTLSTASGTTIEVNGGLLVNNGTQTGTVNANFGAVVKGAGSFGTVNVGDGGQFSPGNSPGTATVAALGLGAGGQYKFELNSAGATPGAGADFTSVTGALTLGAGLSANSRFTVAIVSLDGNNNAAPLADFDPSRNYTFVLVTAAGGISGYNTGEFAVDTSGFGNSLAGGSFAVEQNGNDLDLVFTSSVPELATWTGPAVGGLMWAAVSLCRRIRRKVDPTRS